MLQCVNFRKSSFVMRRITDGNTLTMPSPPNFPPAISRHNSKFVGSGRLNGTFHTCGVGIQL